MKAGVLDDNSNNDIESCEQGGGGGGGGEEGKKVAWEDQTRPLLELYTKRRPLWVAAVEGAVQDDDGSAQKEA